MKRAPDKILFITIAVAALCACRALCVSVTQPACEYVGSCCSSVDIQPCVTGPRLCENLFPAGEESSANEPPFGQRTEKNEHFPASSPLATEDSKMQMLMSMAMTSANDFHEYSVGSSFYLDDRSQRLTAPPELLFMIGISVFAYIAFLFERVISSRKLASRW